MSDERLREAERKWKETGSVDDEARYLLERVRVGDLTRERLELAAYCGHEGARAATASTAPGLTSNMMEVAAHLEQQFGRPACVVAAAAAAETLLGRIAPHAEALVLAALELLRSWLDHGIWADAAGIELAGRARTALLDDLAAGGPSVEALTVAQKLARLPNWPPSRHGVGEGLAWGTGTVIRGAELVTGESMRARVGAALIAWALRGNGPTSH